MVVDAGLQAGGQLVLLCRMKGRSSCVAQQKSKEGDARWEWVDGVSGSMAQGMGSGSLRMHLVLSAPQHEHLR